RLEGLDLLQVMPCAEALAGAGENDDTNALVAFEGIEFLLQGGKHFGRQQVHLLRPVHGPRADPLPLFAQQERAVGFGNGAHVSIALLDLALSRRTNFWILPVEVFGSSPNTTARGALNFAMFCRQNSISSCSVTFESCFISTKAQGVSPHLESGRATTAAAITAGCR